MLADTTFLTLLVCQVLRDACEKAMKAVTESAGKGTESSGSGRFEWGTWIDTDLRNEVTNAWAGQMKILSHTESGRIPLG